MSSKKGTPRFARRAVTVSRRGMIATSQPLAVDAGLEVLKSGGNAIDAAIAANAMLSLVEPMSCGPGGDLFALVWDAAGGQLHALNGSGRAPQGLSIDAFRQREWPRVPERGPWSWTVPGCVDGWATLHHRFGSCPWSDLFASTIGCADAGFEVTPVIAEMWKRAEPLLASDPGSARTFLGGGRAPVRGETFRNPELAQTFRRIAEGGADAFYRGEVARRLGSFAEELGSPLTVDDLAAHTSTWVEPISFTFRGCEVWELPPNTQGLVVLEMLNILEGCDLRGLGHNTPSYLHSLIEAKKLAYENRAFLYADPDFAPLSVGALLGPDHGARQRRRIDPERASWSYAPTAIGAVSDTVYITVVDERRNAVSLIQSIFREFGSGNTPPELGFAIQNRGSLFSLDPDHPNHLEPGKRPFHTIIPAMVTKNGTPVFSFGVMGGDMQPQGQTQILVNMLEFGMDPQLAGEALRVRHDGSSTPEGDVMRDGGEVSLEPGFSTDVLEGLERKGHRVRVRDEGFGGYQGIWIDADTARLLGGSEPRKDGCAKGY